ncbi:MAG TPA: hypothetical protein VGN63_13045 [Flavisolibacter sp.]|jgi:hypothetical protein|nr:hypothetical protein [Flavisolibacter sp.]
MTVQTGEGIHYIATTSSFTNLNNGSSSFNAFFAARHMRLTVSIRRRL